MLDHRPELTGAIARSAHLLLHDLPAHAARDLKIVPALALARGATLKEKARDAELRRALFILDNIDEAIAVHPPLVDELEEQHQVTMLPRAGELGVSLAREAFWFDHRGRLTDAVTRSNRVLFVELPRLLQKGIDRVPAMAFAQGATVQERAHDAELRRALLLLEHIDEVIEVSPVLTQELPGLEVQVTAKGRAVLERVAATRPQARVEHSVEEGPAGVYTFRPVAIAAVPPDRPGLVDLLDASEALLAALPPTDGATITAAQLVGALPAAAREASALAWRVLTMERLVFQFPEPGGLHMLLGLTATGRELVQRRMTAAAMSAAAKVAS